MTPVLAADPTGIVPCGIDKDGNKKLDWDERCTLCDLIVGFKKIFDYVIKTIIIICLACATFAGVMYVVSSGSEKMITSAKDFLKGSLIGLAVVLCSWVIVNTVITILMPTKNNLGIGKASWSDFGEINCTTEDPNNLPIQ